MAAFELVLRLLFALLKCYANLVQLYNMNTDLLDLFITYRSIITYIADNVVEETPPNYVIPRLSIRTNGTAQTADGSTITPQCAAGKSLSPIIHHCTVGIVGSNLIFSAIRDNA